MKLLNIIIFKWFFIRITRCEQRIITKIEPISFGIDGTFSGKVKDSKVKYWYAFQGFIWPLSGWVSRFLFIGKPRFIRITSFYFK